MALLDSILSMVRTQGSTDLHLMANAPPRVRARGELDPLAGAVPLSAPELEQALGELLSPAERQELAEFHDVEATYALPGVGRFRLSCFHTAQGPAAVFHLVPDAAVPLAQLSLPPAFEPHLARRSGLLLIATPVGSGRSTLCASVVDRIATTSSRVVVTLEDPVEIVHARRQAVVLQREVGRDVSTWCEGIDAAMRLDAEVIVLGDLPDAATTRMALRVAEGGRLVIAAPAIPGAIRTLERLVDRFAPVEQAEIRALLADNLVGVLSQVLVRRKDGNGRVAAHEFLMPNTDVTSALREGDLRELAAVLDVGKQNGMRTLDDALDALVKASLITADEARRKASDKSRFAAA